MELLRTAALVAAILTTGLTAGVLYAFACSVMPGLRCTDDRTFVGAFQAMDRAILNPLFLMVFVGAPALAAVAVVLHWGEGSVLAWTLAALAGSLATFVITRAVHLPLNDAIKAAGEPDQSTDLAAVRTRFESRWVRWNLVRTVTSTAALACLAIAMATS